MDDSYEYNSGPITRGAEEVGYFFEKTEAYEIGDETLYSYTLVSTKNCGRLYKV